MSNIRTGVLGSPAKIERKTRSVNTGLVELYFAKFPNSEIPRRVVAEKLAFGHRWTDEGALFNPRKAKPAKDHVAGSDPVDVEVLKVSIGDLIADGAGFSMRQEETTIPIRVETFELNDGSKYKANMPAGELRGISSIDKTHGEQSESRPLLADELVLVLKWGFGPKIFETINEAANWHTGQFWGSVNHASKMATLIRHKLAMLLEDLSQLQNIEDIQDEDEDNFFRWEALWELTPTSNWLAFQGAEPEDSHKAAMAAQAGGLVSRLRRAVASDDLVSGWDYEDQWSLGPREGMVIDRAATNDLNRNPSEEFAEIAHVHQAVEAAAEQNLFSNLYYFGGEPIVEKDSAGNERTRFATRGEKKNFSEERLYLARQAHTREANFKAALWAILTCPLTEVKALGKKFQDQYNGSIRAAAAGPDRVRVATLSSNIDKGDKHAARVLSDINRLGWNNGQWANVPLYGDAARKYIRNNSTTEWMLSLRAPKGGKVVIGDNFRVCKAADWSKTCWKREHMDTLKQAVNDRLGLVKTKVLKHNSTTINTLDELGKWFRANWKPAWNSPAIQALAAECKSNPNQAVYPTIGSFAWSKYGLKVTEKLVQNKELCWDGLPVKEEEVHTKVDFKTMVVGTDHILTRGSISSMVRSDEYNVEGRTLSADISPAEEVTTENLLSEVRSFNS